LSKTVDADTGVVTGTDVSGFAVVLVVVVVSGAKLVESETLFATVVIASDEELGLGVVTSTGGVELASV